MRLIVSLLLAVGLALAGGAPSATAEMPADQPALQAGGASRPTAIYGERAITLKPVEVRSVEHYRLYGGAFQEDEVGSRRLSSARVGWAQWEDGKSGDSRDQASVYETAVKFDLSELDAIDGKVKDATLFLDEEKDRWTSGSGAAEEKVTCVAYLGIATLDWTTRTHNAEVPNKRYSSVPDDGGVSWSVTEHVKKQLRSPGDADLRHGYVLRGSMALANLHGDDNTSCASKVSNIRLYVTMDVAAAAPAPPPPPPPPPPTRPDVGVVRVTGPTSLPANTTATYEIAVWNDGAKGTAQIQIVLVGAIEAMSVEEVTNGSFTCGQNDLGYVCTGSLDGVTDPLGNKRGALVRVQVRGDKYGGSAILIGSVDNTSKSVDINVV
jgi:hypothetical protein